jgi:molecular chaperone IbpA
MKEDNIMSKQDQDVLGDIISNLEGILAHPRVLGLAPIFQDLRSFVSQGIDNYPPHNVVKVSDNHRLIEVAVAGFTSDELDITVTSDTLVITGKSTLVDSPTTEYLHQGVARRPFRLVFKLGDHCKIGDATYQSGMLLVPVDIMTTAGKPPRKVPIIECDSAPDHDGLGAKDEELEQDQFNVAVEEQLDDLAKRSGEGR